jgi:hypothetical protein
LRVGRLVVLGADPPAPAGDPGHGEHQGAAGHLIDDSLEELRSVTAAS